MRAWAIRAAASAVAPGRSTTHAVTCSPHRGCGTPATAASATAGCLSSAASTSRGYTFSPPEMISSLIRPRMTRCPLASSTAPISPVRNQPSAVKAVAVAAGSPQYPPNTCGPRSWISPSAPGTTPPPGGAVIGGIGHTRHSTPGSGSPTVSARARPSGLDTSRPDSVVPYRTSGSWPSRAGSSRARPGRSGADPHTASRRRPSRGPATGDPLASAPLASVPSASAPCSRAVSSSAW